MASRLPLLISTCAVASILALSLGVGAFAAYSPPAEGQMAVVFAPWVGEGQTVAAIIRAGGRLVGASRFDNIFIAYALDPGFAARVREQGAWFTVAAQGLCSPAPVLVRTI